MAVDHLIHCGDVSGAGLPTSARAPLCLRLWGPRPNVFVRIEDLDRALWRRVPEAFQDLVDLAAYVYCADQAIPRGSDKDEAFGARWRRRLHFAVSVRRPELWSRPDLVQELVTVLSFLSEDEYHFHFEPLCAPPQFDSYLAFGGGCPFGGGVEDVVLFSGGLDSFAGAVQEALVYKRPVLLVTHCPNPKLEPVPAALAREVAARAPGSRPAYLPVRVNKQRGLSRESTQRTRSFLFASLAAALAAMLGRRRVFFYENGVASLNLPPATQVVGARASRTTHPRVLDGLRRLLTQVADGPFEVENPFRWMTKADVLRVIAAAGCADLIGRTRSCSRPREATRLHPHCGICSQCIDRRFAVLAAGLAEHDPAGTYRVDLLTGERPAGHAQTMLAVYAEMASQIARMSPSQFFSRYGEAARALTAFGSEPPEVVAQRVFGLYQQHARDVNAVIDRAIGEYSARLRQRTLPGTCLLRMVWGEYPGPDGPAAAPPPGPPPGQNVFRRYGQAWQVRFAGGGEFILLPTKGAAYLHLLLGSPGVSLSAVDMAARLAKEPGRYALGSAGPLIDGEARAAFRARFVQLKEELEDAQACNDPGREARVRKDMTWLLEQIKKGRALGGRLRPAAGDDRERVRIAVANAIARAVREIGRQDAALAKHLRPPRLRCGHHPCYQPPPGTTWET